MNNLGPTLAGIVILLLINTIANILIYLHVAEITDFIKYVMGRDKKEVMKEHDIRKDVDWAAVYAAQAGRGFSGDQQTREDE